MSLRNLSAKKKIPKILSLKLNNKKINQIYKKFERTLDLKTNFAVAVSGGPDSLALAFLAKVYALKNKLTAKFFIVDHKIRLESKKEAKFVKQILSKFKIDTEILTWNGKKPTKNIQSLARKKRYNLLYSRCDKFKIKNILLGHHQDDLIENFFIRMLRGSGLRGLVSLDKKNKIENKILLRPLLNQKKENLIFLSNHVFNSYIKDPSNKEEKYQRTRIRKFIQDLKKEGLDKKKFMKTIKNLKSSNSVINFYVDKNLKTNTFISSLKNKLVINNDFFQQPYEIIFRSLSEAIKLIGRNYYSVRGKKLDKIIHEILNNKIIRTTLGGCVIEKVNQTIIISKER